MTDTPENGGPAFPAIQANGKTILGGMSLRDYFAGQALANPDICRRDDDFPHKTAYAFADAMMRAREGGDA